MLLFSHSLRSTSLRSHHPPSIKTASKSCGWTSHAMKDAVENGQDKRINKVDEMIPPITTIASSCGQPGVRAHGSCHWNRGGSAKGVPRSEAFRQLRSGFRTDLPTRSNSREVASRSVCASRTKAPNLCHARLLARRLSASILPTDSFVDHKGEIADLFPQFGSFPPLRQRATGGTCGCPFQRPKAIQEFELNSRIQVSRQIGNIFPELRLLRHERGLALRGIAGRIRGVENAGLE